jgi:hypothetical protein
MTIAFWGPSTVNEQLVTEEGDSDLSNVAIFQNSFAFCALKFIKRKQGQLGINFKICKIGNHYLFKTNRPFQFNSPARNPICTFLKET